MKNIKIIILIVLLTISLTGCASTYTNEKTDESIELDSEFKTYESKLGFSLQFPRMWGKNYIIIEHDDLMEVSFVGNSEESKNYDEESKVNGLNLFYIGSEDYVYDNEFLDSVREIGKANDMRFYYFTSTDFPLGALTSDYIKDENDKKLAKDDYLIATEMKNDIEDIINSFKSLE